MVMIIERWAKWLLGHLEKLPGEGMCQLRTGTEESAPDRETHACAAGEKAGTSASQGALGYPDGENTSAPAKKGLECPAWKFGSSYVGCWSEWNGYDDRQGRPGCPHSRGVMISHHLQPLPGWRSSTPGGDLCCR